MRIPAVLVLIMLNAATVRAADQESDLHMLRTGLDYYATGKYASAADAFKEALRYRESMDIARYWLAMSFLKSSQPGSARKQFLRLSANGASDPRVYMGLGNAYLMERNRAFEALRAFQKAAAIDSTESEAHYLIGVAYLTLMGRGPVAEHPYVDRARTALERALSIEPGHRDAAYRLGELFQGETLQNRYFPNRTDSFYTMGLPYEGMALNTMSAMAAYERQMKHNPEHLEARRALAILNSRLGNHDSAIQALETLSLVEPENTDRLLELATGLWRAKNWTGAEEIFDRVLPMLPDKERELYVDFAGFVRREDAERYEDASDEKRLAMWDRFFAMRDPVPLTEVNERLVEHYGRVAYSRQAFSSKGVFPWDRRGDFVVRYGLPDHVESGSHISGISETGPAPGAARKWGEAWFYLHIPLTLYFENRLFSRRYDFPPVFAGSNGGDYDQPFYVAREAVRRLPSMHVPRELGLPFEFVHDAVAFRESDGTTRLEIAFGLERESNQIRNTGIVDKALDIGTVLYGPDFSRVVVDSLWSPLFVPTEDENQGLVIAVQGFRVPPGEYWMAMQAHDRLFGLYNVKRDSVAVPDLSGPSLELSGIRLATEISANIEDLPFDARLPNRLAPHPTSMYHRGSPLHFYLELYGLTLNSNDEASFEVEVSVHPVGPSMKDRNIFWRVLSRLGNLADRTRDDQVVSFVFDEHSFSAEASWTSAIDTSELALGSYRLEIEITDSAIGASAVSSRDFEVVR